MPNDMDKIIKFRGLLVKVSVAIHSRMMKHYAIKTILENVKNEKITFSDYFKKYALDNISSDAPYKYDKDGWRIDCLIKSSLERCLNGFEKTVAALGEERFAKSLNIALDEVREIASSNDAMDRIN